MFSSLESIHHVEIERSQLIKSIKYWWWR